MTRQRGHVRRIGSVWRLYYRCSSSDGGRRRLTSQRLGTVAEIPTRAAARRAADRLIERLAPQALHAGQVITWQRWCTIYCERHLVLLARGTRETRTSIIEGHLVPAFAGRAVHAIDGSSVQAFVTDQYRAGVAVSTIRARFEVLRRVLRTAKESGLPVVPPSAAEITFPRKDTVGASVRAKAFTPDEVKRILEAAREPLRTACALARYLALRSSEVVGLAWPAIDLEQGRIEIRQQALDGRIRPLKAASAHATLVIPPLLAPILAAYREQCPQHPSQLLFADEAGAPLESRVLRQQLHALLDELELPRKGLHAFRHACALAMAQAGVNPEALRRALRHASLRNTAIYLSATPEDIAAALVAGQR